MRPEIKETQGQTLLVLLRIAIFGLACLCVFGMRTAAESVFTYLSQDRSLTENTDTSPQGSVYGRPYALYYDNAVEGASRHTYKYYYISGSEDALGLVDASGNVLLEQKYQGIFVLPEGYILKEDGYWRFYDRELNLLSDNAWETAQPALDENNKLRSELVKVSRDGLFGAVNMRGEVVISPRWDSLNIFNPFGLKLMRVSKDGSFGFIYPDGDTAVGVRYEYAQIGQYFHDDPNGGEETASETVIYVRQDGEWGCIFMDSDGDPSWQDWGVQPGEEVLNAYEEYRASQAG